MLDHWKCVLLHHCKRHKPPAALQYFKYVESETVPVFLSSAFVRISRNKEDHTEDKGIML